MKTFPHPKSGDEVFYSMEQRLARTTMAQVVDGLKPTIQAKLLSIMDEDGDGSLDPRPGTNHFTPQISPLRNNKIFFLKKKGTVQLFKNFQFLNAAASLRPPY